MYRAYRIVGIGSSQLCDEGWTETVWKHQKYKDDADGVKQSRQRG